MAQCTRPAHAPHTPCTRPAHALHTPCTRPAHTLHMPCTFLPVARRTVRDAVSAQRLQHRGNRPETRASAVRQQRPVQTLRSRRDRARLTHFVGVHTSAPARRRRREVMDLPPVVAAQRVESRRREVRAQPGVRCVPPNEGGGEVGRGRGGRPSYGLGLRWPAPSPTFLPSFSHLATTFPPTCLPPYSRLSTTFPPTWLPPSTVLPPFYPLTAHLENCMRVQASSAVPRV